MDKLLQKQLNNKLITRLPDCDLEVIEQFILDRKKKQRDEIVEMIKEYLLMEHEHYGDLPFKKGRPYIDSLDFEKFIINSLKK